VSAVCSLTDRAASSLRSSSCPVGNRRKTGPLEGNTGHPAAPRGAMDGLREIACGQRRFAGMHNSSYCVITTFLDDWKMLVMKMVCCGNGSVSFLL
jgi:hypothetical protein